MKKRGLRRRRGRHREHADDAGAIYAINPATNAVVDVFTVPGATTNPHVIVDTQFITDNFNTAFDAVGKVSLGGIALSADEARLFAMNLENRTLYALNTTTGAVEASTPVPLNPPGCAAAGDVRPFAVDTHLGVGYIGLVCSAESTPATPANLRGYVYSFNQATLAISAAPVFELARITRVVSPTAV